MHSAPMQKVFQWGYQRQNRISEIGQKLVTQKYYLTWYTHKSAYSVSLLIAEASSLAGLKETSW